MHVNVIHEGSEIAEILGSDNLDVLERGRETRPTAPVHCDTAEHTHKSEEIRNAMEEGEDNRRRETRPSAPEVVHLADRELQEG